jgi:hypothetical protein
MPQKKTSNNRKNDLEVLYATRVKKQAADATWVVRITEHKDKPVPVFVVKERLSPEQRDDTEDMIAPRSVLKERGLLYGEQQTRVLPVIQTILSRIRDAQEVPLELHRFLSGRRIDFRGNLPLDEEAGCKLALIFKLQERIKEMDRVELMARRIDRFTREEAAYWYSRISSYGPIAGRWAMAGMKVMMAGHPKDPGVETLLDRLRGSY